MHADGTRPARAWDDVVAPPVPPSPVAPVTASPAPPVRPPHSGNGAGPSSNGGSAPVTAAPPPVHLGATSLAAAPVTARTPIPPPPPAPPAPDRVGPERTNGHLRAAPVPLADPDLDDPLEDTTPGLRPPRRRPERDRQQRPGLATRRRRRKSRARKVRRQIRHIDAWSVLKFSLLFYLVLYLVVLVAGVLLWNAATSTGLVDNVESFVEELFGFETFQFEPNQMLRAAALTGLVLVLAGTTMNVLMAVLFNLISDLIGGIKVTVIEEERRRPLV